MLQCNSLAGSKDNQNNWVPYVLLSGKVVHEHDKTSLK